MAMRQIALAHQHSALTALIACKHTQSHTWVAWEMGRCVYLLGSTVLQYNSDQFVQYAYPYSSIISLEMTKSA